MKAHLIKETTVGETEVTLWRSGSSYWVNTEVGDEGRVLADELPYSPSIGARKRVRLAARKFDEVCTSLA